MSVCFFSFFLHTITVQTRKAPLRKTKSREETIAATILPSNVDVVTPHEADDSTFNDDVFTVSVAKSQHSTNTHTYTHTILSYEHRKRLCDLPIDARTLRTALVIVSRLLTSLSV